MPYITMQVIFNHRAIKLKLLTCFIFIPFSLLILGCATSPKTESKLYWLASLTPDQQEEYYKSLSDEELFKLAEEFKTYKAQQQAKQLFQNAGDIFLSTGQALLDASQQP